MDLWAGAILERSCQRTGGSAIWSASDGVRNKGILTEKQCWHCFQFQFLFSLVLENFMVKHSKLLPPNAIASCCVFVGILWFLISMVLSTPAQGCLATPFPVVLDGLVSVGLSVSLISDVIKIHYYWLSFGGFRLSVENLNSEECVEIERSFRDPVCMQESFLECAESFSLTLLQEKPRTLQFHSSRLIYKLDF